MIKDIITSLLFVEDIKKSLKFYEKLFDQDALESSEIFCSFKFEHTYFNLHLADRRSPISKGGSVPYFEPKDFDSFMKHALSLEMKVYRGPLFIKETGRRICQLEDPFGNVIGVEA